MPPKPGAKKASVAGPAPRGGQHRKSVAPKMFKDDDDVTELDGKDDEWVPSKALVKPDDQLQLSEVELKEEHTRILTANNPHAPQNIIRYSFKDRQYKVMPNVEHLAIHFTLSGNLIHKESDEARRQRSRMSQDTGEQTISEATEEKGTGEEVEAEAEKTEGEGKEGDAGEEGGTPAPTNEAKLTNQFNFSERASQTYNNPYRERGTATEPPPRATFSGNVTQWEIFDAYQEDFERQEKSKEKKVVPGRKEEETKKKKLTTIDSQSDDISKVDGAAKIIERMVNQNIYDEIAQDFKYWEDVSDEYRDQEGSLLPLWRFSFDKAKKLAVTALCWSPRYPDLFAAGYGSYDFTKQTTGLITLYTLKNPSYPEYVFETKSGVLCLDIHPVQSQQICVGFYDGSVAVFDIMTDKKTPSYLSTAKTGKHTDPVWQVRWQKEDLDNNLNFYSISTDGRVACWTLVKNELHCNDVIKLNMDEAELGSESEQIDATRITTLGGGTAIDFHREKDYLFLVGTQEGRMHTCSKAYSSAFLDTYMAHHMPIYRVAWNVFHPDIFISSSDDWTVKIWDNSLTKKEPVFTFDLNSPISDVAWAPYSSTVFAAVTAEGKVFVYDLNVNKYDPICEQMVVSKKHTKLTHIAFNQTAPILVVGDDRGFVHSLKISPNLRKQPKEKKGQEQMKPEEREAQKREHEFQKLEKLLVMVRPGDNAASSGAAAKEK